MNNYIIIYLIGFVINIFLFYSYIYNDPLTTMKLQQQSIIQKIFTHILLFLICASSWLLILVDLVSRICKELEHDKKN